MMQQRAKVRNVRADGTAQVVVIRESACSGDCHKCSGCGAAQETLVFDAINAIGAKAGEVVLVESETAPVLCGAAMVYMVPLGLFFLGYLIGALALGKGALFGFVGFVAGIALAAWYDRKVASKKNVIYTITGYVAGFAADLYEKGENDVD